VTASQTRQLTTLGLWVLGGLFCPEAAEAASDRVLLLPTAVSSSIDCEGSGSVDPRWQNVARHVDILVADAVEDAGLDPELRIEVPGAAAESGGCVDDAALLQLPRQTLLIAPRLVIRDGKLLLRILSLRPGATVMGLSAQEVTEKELDFRVVVMISELLAPENQRGSSNTQASPKAPSFAPMTGSPAAKPRSQGKGVLALTGAVWGGAIGYSLQRSSGSDDPRLTYPLILLGSGLGLGAAMVASDEWDLSVGEAWYFNAGMLWPTASGLLLARFYEHDENQRYVYGLLGATTGAVLASTALSFSDEMREGSAVLTHSSGASGLLLGGLVDMIYHNGTTDQVPYRGMGYGAGIGVLIGGLAATQAKPSSSRVLFIDLSAGLGALTGAAVGSPLLIFEKDIVAARKQAWLGLIGVGAVVGAGAGWYLTRHWNMRDPDSTSTQVAWWPYVTASPTQKQVHGTLPAELSAGVQGLF
jgi:hypothetical protein